MTSFSFIFFSFKSFLLTLFSVMILSLVFVPSSQAIYGGQVTDNNQYPFFVTLFDESITVKEHNEASETIDVSVDIKKGKYKQSLLSDLSVHSHLTGSHKTKKVSKNKFMPAASYCGGALLTEYIVLTASHCVLDYDEETAKHAFVSTSPSVKTNLMTGVSSALPGQQIAKFKKIFLLNSVKDVDAEADPSNIFPASVMTIDQDPKKDISEYFGDFDSFVQRNLPDLAVIYLETPITNKTPISILKTPLYKNDSLLALGAGSTENTEKMSTVLRKADLQKVNSTFCRKYRKYKESFNKELYFCARGNKITQKTSKAHNRYVDTCYGDSGSPIIKYVDNTPYLAGVVSYGLKEKCGASAAYASIYHFQNILDYIVTELSGNPELAEAIN